MHTMNGHVLSEPDWFVARRLAAAAEQHARAVGVASQPGRGARNRRRSVDCAQRSVHDGRALRGRPPCRRADSSVRLGAAGGPLGGPGRARTAVTRISHAAMCQSIFLSAGARVEIVLFTCWGCCYNTRFLGLRGRVAVPGCFIIVLMKYVKSLWALAAWGRA